ncbi:NfrA family protein [Rheinheimera faecalis]|uniref:NfrA family protein n=1 Tax=Rheinheimera faecalis TaxID=2901141 RepID=UPI001E53C231|nr:hypothetical protein [Rheinheimera faecalis]
MIRLNVVLLSMLCSGGLTSAVAMAEPMTDYQKFRTYHYIEKAQRLQQQNDLPGAIAEINRALTLLPGQSDLLLLRFNYQMEAGDLAGVRQTVQQLPRDKQHGLYPAALLLQLSQQTQPDMQWIDQQWPTLSAADQHYAAKLVIQRFIVLEQQQQAYQWLTVKQPLSADLTRLHASLAGTLGLHKQVIDDLSSLPPKQLSDPETDSMVMALMQNNQSEQAYALIEKQPYSSSALLYYRQQLQQQLALRDWVAAEQSFAFIERYHQLEPQEQQQKFQLALVKKDWPLALQMAGQQELNCWQRIDLYMQAGNEKLAELLFQSCPASEDPQSWLVYAEKWLAADQVASEPLAGSFSQAQQQLVAQKRRNVSASQHRRYKATGPDDRSYQLVRSGQPDKALAVLTKALPFSNQVQQQGILPQRLLQLLSKQEPINTDILSKTDDWTVLRVERAELWRLAGRCDKTLQLLTGQTDTAQGWRSLALCQDKDSAEFALAQWQKAYQLDPQVSDQLAMAYLHLQLDDPQAALSAFTRMKPEQLLDKDKQSVAQLALELDQAELGERYLLASSGDRADWYLAVAERLHVKDSNNQKNNQQALSYLEKITTASDKQWAEVHLQKAWIYQSMQDYPAAEQSWQTALQKAPDDARLHAGYGYLLIRLNRDDEALIQLKQAAKSSQYKNDVAMKGQIAYLSADTKNLDETLYWLEEAIDAQQAPVKQNALTATELYRLKRYHQNISKNWQVTASTAVRHGASLTVLDTAANEEPDIEPIRNDAIMRLEYFQDALQRDLSVYMQLSTNGSSDHYYNNWGHEYGLSYKPLNHTNLWLSAAVQQYPLGEGDWRALLRLSGDFFNQGKWQSEWQSEQDHWRERKLFVDAVYWPDGGQLLLQSKFEQGKAFRLDDSLFQIVRPYALSQLDYRKQKAPGSGLNAEGWQWTAGLGVQSRFGLGETHYDAYRHKWELNLEWQYQLAGDLSEDQHALSLQLSYQY